MASQTKTPTRKNHGSANWTRLRQLFFSRNKALKFGDTEGLNNNQNSEGESPTSLRRQPKSLRIFIHPSSNELRKRHLSGDGQPSIKTTPRSHTTLASPFTVSDKIRQRSMRWNWKKKIDEPSLEGAIEEDEDNNAKQDENQSTNLANEKTQCQLHQHLVIHQLLPAQDTEIERTSDEAKNVEPSVVLTTPVSTNLSNSHQSLVGTGEIKHENCIGCHHCKGIQSYEVCECTEHSNKLPQGAASEDIVKATDYPQNTEDINQLSPRSNILSHIPGAENGLDLDLRLGSFLVPISTDGDSLQNKKSNESDKMLILSPKSSKPSLTFTYSKNKVRKSLRKVQSADDGDCPWGLKSKDTDSFNFDDRGTLRGFRMTDFSAVLKQRKGTGVKTKIESDDQDSEFETEVVPTGPVELHKDDFIDFSSQKTRWKVNWGKEN